MDNENNENVETLQNSETLESEKNNIRAEIENEFYKRMDEKMTSFMNRYLKQGSVVKQENEEVGKNKKVKELRF